MTSTADPSTRDVCADWRELSALYEQADALDDGARAAWLARLRDEGHRLLPDLARMLDARERAARDGFLESLPLLDVDGPDVATTPPLWQEGSRIGAYRLVRRVGAGGMAEVWLGERADGAFDRKVAIKLLFDHPLPGRRASFVERFRRERDILASLDHPNVAALHDAGVAAGGQPWLALEYVQGEPIVAWCDGRRSSVRERVALFQQVLAAVGYAHRHLIVHRDLKPPNILVTSNGSVRLLDFGIAKLLADHDVAADETELTRAAGRLMTLQYASPEQVAGEPLSTSSDVYSAAAVLYELVSGARPHGDPRRSALALENAIRNEPVRPASRAATDAAASARREPNAAALRKAIGRDLDAILLFALEKSPARRYPTVDAFGADLERWQRGLPIEARRTSAAERTVKFVKRHPLAVALGTAAIAGLLVTTAIAVAMSLSARREAQRVTASRDFLLDIFQQSDPDQARGRELTAKEILQGGRMRAEKTLDREPKLQAELIAAIASVQASLGDRVEAERGFARAVDNYRGHGLWRDALQSQLSRVDNLVLQGDYVSASKELGEARSMLKRISADDAVLATLHSMQAIVAWQQDRLEEAAQSFSTALEFARTGFPAADPRTVDLLINISEVEADLRRIPVARAHVAEAVRLSEAVALPSYAVTAAAAAAKVETLDGRLPAAIGVLDDAVARCERTLGADAEQCGVLRIRLALLCLRTERIAKAASLLPALVRRADKAGSARRQSEAMLVALRVAAAQGADTAAHPLRARIERIAASRHDAGNDDTYASANLALTEVELRAERSRSDRDTRAQLARLDAVESVDPAGASVLDLRARARLLRGLVLVRSGDAAGAREAFDAAHAGFVAHYGGEHPYAVLVGLDRAFALCALRREAQATDLARRSTILLRTRLSTAEAVVARWESTDAMTTLCQSLPEPYFF